MTNRITPAFAAQVTADLQMMLGNRPFKPAGLASLAMGADWQAVAATIVRHHAIPLENGFAVFPA